ncbi:MAG TPA: hypothetical protein VMR14_14785 [Streptosporangiaceae bacterium]|nr:hypothetical protein [Streptosporangiaceae bacterium]
MPDLTDKLQQVADDVASAARPIAVADVIRLGERRRHRVVAQRSLGGLAVAGIGAAVIFAGVPRAPLPGGGTATPVFKTTGQAIAWAKAQARAEARKMLADQQLPPGARPTSARRLRAPVPTTAALTIGNQRVAIDLHRLYFVPDSEAQVSRFLRKHSPADAVNLGYGTSTVSDGTAQFVDYMLRKAPAGTDGTMLVSSMFADPAGGTVLRLDAQVIWSVPRSQAEYVNAASFRAITVTKLSMSSGSTSKVIRSRSLIATIAHALNGLGTTRGGLGCPDVTSELTMTFEPRSAAVKPVAISVGCGVAVVTVGTVRQPLLATSDALPRLLNRLLGPRA